jgi:phosphoribosylglycinamide formyltransferase-1
MADKVRVAVLLSGRGSNMLALSEYKRRELDRHYEIALVASNVPEARGLVLAKRFGIRTWSKSHRGMAREDFDALLDAVLREHGIELVALAGYMRLLSTDFVRKWEGRILNIHPSLLPQHKGLDTHQRALLAGDEFAGCSVHIVTPELDDGPVIAQARVKILPRDDADSLAARVLEAEHRLYPQALDEYCRMLREDEAKEGKDAE